MDYRGRQQRLWEKLQKKGLDGLIAKHLPNVLYVSGFTGSSGVLAVSKGKWALFTDGRYTEQARAEAKGIRLVIAEGSALGNAAKWLECAGAKSVGMEAEHLSVSEHKFLKKSIRSTRLRPTAGFVEELRIIKDADEMQRVRVAAALGTSLLDRAIECVRPGVAETKIAAEIEYEAKTQGASGMAFDTIIAGGNRSALPHGRASSTPLPRRGFVLMDFGVVHDHYCSDMTRTIHVGRPSAEAKAMYAAVREAQQAAIEMVRPGVELGRVDGAARNVLKRSHLAKYFTHSTGHGVGIEVHEMPRVAKGVEDTLEPGMVVTIEPGVYVWGCGGVRIEDMVLVTETGCEVLTQAPKDLVIV